MIVKLITLEEHLAFLITEENLCLEDGDWDRLDRIRLAIDDTRDQIKKEEQQP